MIDSFALITILLAAFYFLALGFVSLFKSEKASGFLLGFVASAFLHYVELGIRIVIGAAFVLGAPRMLFPEIFSFFGWLIIATSACLLVIPWRWHQRFAKRSVPQALRYLKLVAVSSLALGVFIIVCAFLGSGTR